MLFDRPWGRPPTEACSASCSAPSHLRPPTSHPTCSQWTPKPSLRSQGKRDALIARVAAPEAAEKETAVRKASNIHKGDEPMVYENEEVNYGDGAVTKVCPIRHATLATVQWPIDLCIRDLYFCMQ